VEITVVDVPDRSRFEIRADGETAGVAAYHRRPGVIAFVHTEIDPRFEGQGLASKVSRMRTRDSGATIRAESW
jgi:predicted GNAT family acetyltransferase